jgi:hypothetical protein
MVVGLEVDAGMDVLEAVGEMGWRLIKKEAI